MTQLAINHAAALADALNEVLRMVPPKMATKEEREDFERAQREADAVLDRYRLALRAPGVHRGGDVERTLPRAPVEGVCANCTAPIIPGQAYRPGPPARHVSCPTPREQERTALKASAERIYRDAQMRGAARLA